MPTVQRPRVVAFSVEGDGLNARRLYRFAIERFLCKYQCHVYLRVRGEVAEWPKAAVC